MPYLSQTGLILPYHVHLYQEDIVKLNAPQDPISIRFLLPRISTLQEFYYLEFIPPQSLVLTPQGSYSLGSLLPLISTTCINFKNNISHRSVIRKGSTHNDQNERNFLLIRKKTNNGRMTWIVQRNKKRSFYY